MFDVDVNVVVFAVDDVAAAVFVSVAVDDVHTYLFF